MTQHAVPSALQTLQRRYAAQVSDELRFWLALAGGLDAFRGMLEYQLGHVDARLQPIAGGGGKRFRPLLCLAACEGAGGNPRDALGVAAAIELMHNFSLIHDDIEDHDPARHHRDTVWRVWGEPQAINSGDAMFALAGRAAAGAVGAPASVLRVVRSFQEMALAMTRGQYLDMSFESRERVGINEYIEMATLKSAAIVAFSAWSGGFLGGADDRACEALERFGRNLGVAFQIADDIKGIWGRPEETGKEAAKDLHNRKKTLPVLIGMDRAPGALAAFYTARVSDDIKAVIDVLDRTDARAAAEDEMLGYRARALDALPEGGLSAQGREELAGLAMELTG